jgi:hypothetical protein
MPKSVGPKKNSSLVVSLLLVILVVVIAWFLYSRGYLHLKNQQNGNDNPPTTNEMTNFAPGSVTPGFPKDFPFGKEVKVLQNFTFTTGASVQSTRQYTTSQSPQVIYRSIKDFLTKRNWIVDNVLSSGQGDTFYSFEAVNNLDRLSINFNKTETGEWIVDASLTSQKVLKTEKIPDPVRN